MSGEQDNSKKMALMAKFELDLRAAATIRPLLELRRKYATSWLQARQRHDQQAELIAINGIEYCNTEVQAALLIPIE